MYQFLKLFGKFKISSLVAVVLFSYAQFSSASWNTLVYPNGVSGNDANAISFSEFKDLAKNGLLMGTYTFTKGNYNVHTHVTLAPNTESVRIEAEDGALFIGDYSPFAEGSTQSANSIGGGFMLATSNVTFENIHFEDVRACFRVKKGAVVNNIKINGMTSTNSHSCILVDRYMNATVNNWDIQDVVIKDYYRVGIRVAGANTQNISISNFLIDGKRPSSKTSHCWKAGIQVYEKAHDIDIRNGEVRNNHGTCTGYGQGDGIEADDKQGAPENITIHNVIVRDSGDANLDIKAKNVQMSNITSTSNMSKSAFKLWSYSGYKCNECTVVGDYAWMFRLYKGSELKLSLNNPSIKNEDNYLTREQ